MSLDGSHQDAADEEAITPLLQEYSKKDSRNRRGKVFLTHGRSTTAILTSADAEISHDKFDIPRSYQLAMTQMALSLGYTAYMMTSWFDTSLRHKILFPQCTDYWASWTLTAQWMSWGCVGTILLYWTFPIFCCQVLLLYFYRDLLQTRMYYMMFAHQVHLDFMNVPFFAAPSVRMMIAWMLFCFMMYPLAGIVTFRRVLQTLPYWIPVGSFFGMLYSQWDLESRLVSVSKLVENDVVWAGRHVRNSFFLRDYIAEEAFQKVREQLDEQKPAPQLSTSEYILQIALMAEKIHEDNLHDEEGHQERLKKRASTTIFHAVSPWYWGHQFLYSPYLVDARAQNFHVWFRIYFAFTLVLMLILAFFAISTILTLLHMQGITPKPLINWINWLAMSPNEGSHSESPSFLGISEWIHTLRGSGFMQFFNAENVALQTENGALQRENAALLDEISALKAGALRAHP